jgi:hypothetical protein
LAKVEITHIGFETLIQFEQYMAEFIKEPELLSEQLIDIAADKLGAHPESCPICPELEEIGILDYLQLTIDQNYKILYRYNKDTDTVFIMAFIRTKQSAEKLLVRLAMIT